MDTETTETSTHPDLPFTQVGENTFDLSGVILNPHG
jgi:hypothetical protein